jgi:hypothetical protein
VLGRVGDVLLDDHGVVAHAERVDELAPRRRQLGRGRQRVELLEVVGADALDECLLGVLLHPAGLVDEERLAGQVERRESQPRAAARPPRGVRHRVGRRERHQVRSQLGGEPAGGERRDAGAEAGHGPDGVRGQGCGHELAAHEGHTPHSRSTIERAVTRVVRARLSLPN